MAGSAPRSPQRHRRSQNPSEAISGRRAGPPHPAANRRKSRSDRKHRDRQTLHGPHAARCRRRTGGAFGDRRQRPLGTARLLGDVVRPLLPGNPAPARGIRRLQKQGIGNLRRLARQRRRQMENVRGGQRYAMDQCAGRERRQAKRCGRHVRHFVDSREFPDLAGGDYRRQRPARRKYQGPAGGSNALIVSGQTPDNRSDAPACDFSGHLFSQNYAQ